MNAISDIQDYRCYFFIGARFNGSVSGLFACKEIASP